MRILEIDQLTAYVQDMFETDPILSDVWVRGEITNSFESRAGHCYLTLSGDGSQLKAVIFKGSRWRIEHSPNAGDVVVAHGNVAIYADQGQYQLYIDYLASDGVGLLQMKLEELRLRLESEGLFDPSRKRPIPTLPQTIGVVTSAQGAVLHDILTVLKRRFPAVDVVVSPSAVQGATAPIALVQALNRLWEDGSSDVIIIARGGGAPEELAVFNDEQLARAIFRSPIPVISAVGHETDTTIADLVSDLRAPTPSAAAELAVPDQNEIKLAISSRLGELRDSMHDRLGIAVREIEQRKARTQQRSPNGTIERESRSAEMYQLRAATAIQRRIAVATNRLETRSTLLSGLNPVAVLDRGYAAVETIDGDSRLLSVQEIRDALLFRVTMRDGSATVRYEEVGNQ